MTPTKTLFVLAPAALLAACATTSANEDDGSTPDHGGGAMCDAAATQSFVGQKATAENGARIRDEAGARQLRWGPPDSAWTMDFRPDRVNVRYDRDMTITEITCG